MIKKILFSTALLCSQFAMASNLEVVHVNGDSWAIVGDKTQRNKDNLGNNATFGVIVTKSGVILIDAGGSYQGAKEIDEKIDEITELPVKYVINTGGQDHRWFGNDYWSQQGAEIIASNETIIDQENRGSAQAESMKNFISEGFDGTELYYADRGFDDEINIILGAKKILIRHVGAAHTPGDAFVWNPSDNVMYTGDIVYLERMLGVGSQSNSKTWVESFEAIEAYDPKHIVPGHGSPSSLATAQKDTYDYLVYLREKVAELIDEGGDIMMLGDIDQSQWSYLENYDSLSGKNIQSVFEKMEWE